MKKKLILTLALLFYGVSAFADNISIPAVFDGKITRLEMRIDESGDFYRYANPRFKFNAFVPACVTKALLPMNGDGVFFTNDDKTVEYTVSGHYNSTFSTAEKEYYDILRFIGKDTVTYSDWGRGWYVVSGVKDGRVYYIYCIVGEVTVSTMSFEYPYDQKDQYDWMIPVLVENFHSGNMGG